jgi:hypothetical protein
VGLVVWADARTVWGRSYDLKMKMWSSLPVPLTVPGAGTLGNGAPRVAVNSSGVGIAIWSQASALGKASSIYSAMFHPTPGWSMPELAEFNDADDASLPSVAISEDGEAFGVWLRGGTKGVYANHRGAIGPWDMGGEARVDQALQAQAISPSVAIDACGNGLVAFIEQIPPQHQFAYAASNIAGSGWTPPARLDSSTGDVSELGIAMTPGGTAAAVWTEGGLVVSGNYYTGESWTLPFVVAMPMPPRTSVQYPVLTISEGGFPFVAFESFDPVSPLNGEIDIQHFR